MTSFPQLAFMQNGRNPSQLLFRHSINFGLYLTKTKQKTIHYYFSFSYMKFDFISIRTEIFRFTPIFKLPSTNAASVLHLRVRFKSRLVVSCQTSPMVTTLK